MTSPSINPPGILDTSAVITLPSLPSAAWLPDAPMITTVTLAELSVGPLVATDPSERARRQVVLQQAEVDFEALPFDAAAARAFGRVGFELRRAGRKPAARSYDVLIAAVALSRGLAVYTANAKDFTGIAGLTVINVLSGPAGGAEAGPPARE